MEIKLIDISEIKKLEPKRYEIKEAPGEKCESRTVPLETIAETDIIFCEEVACERMKMGVTNNCVICENKNNEVFARCKTKYKTQ